MSPDREARAAALRAHLSEKVPSMLAFMDEMKAGFDAVVLHVQADEIEQGKEQTPGVQPYIPLPSKTWGYGVGESPARVVGTGNPKRKRK